MIERKNKFLDAANFFLIAGLLIGIFYCVTVPYGAGFDEERHLVRIYYMSENKYLPVFSDVSIHQEVFEFSYQRRLVQSPAFDLFTRENFTRRFSASDDLRYGQGTQSIYSPVIFCRRRCSPDTCGGNSIFRFCRRSSSSESWAWQFMSLADMSASARFRSANGCSRCSRFRPAPCFKPPR